MIRLEIDDGDPGKLDLVLGQACQILGDGGHALAQGLDHCRHLDTPPGRRLLPPDPRRQLDRVKQRSRSDR